MTIELSNHIPDMTLRFDNAMSQSGSLPQALPAQIETGKNTSVRASSKWKDCTGSFNLESADAAFAVSYVHPLGPQATIVGVTPSEGYLSFANAATFPGHNSLAKIKLYRGVATGKEGLVAPLALLETPARNNCQDFANSMFGSTVRDVSAIQAAYTGTTDKGFVPPADFTGGQLAGFVAQWLQRWLKGDTYAGLPMQDAQLIDLLKSYTKSAANTGPLTMWVPQITYRTNTEPAIFELTEYRSFAFADASGNWQEDNVSAFLTLLASGSHFVAISATKDLPSGTSMQAFDTYVCGSDLQTKVDIGNSQYASLVNLTGKYYLNIDGDFAPEDCGLMLSFLYGRTVNNLLSSPGTYNTFIQLEGWQSGGARHQTDFNTYKKTLWNISTYGASAYSEKRATSIFLAPSGWTPQVYQTTRMMPYVGAYARSKGKPQPWLNTSLVSIPADAPELPLRYVL
ncbi:hypothetical protein [Phyllobacterium sp. 628]|uniref:hypothetical protein n=1 Tax=Phyllobacterium sp. 628 TaxID=2718938 RepID=UPI001AEE760C|nr:hypothetical protein [Phyllobacterium sp. 628]